MIQSLSPHEMIKHLNQCHFTAARWTTNYVVSERSLLHVIKYALDFVH